MLGRNPSAGQFRSLEVAVGDQVVIRGRWFCGRAAEP